VLLQEERCQQVELDEGREDWVMLVQQAAAAGQAAAGALGHAPGAASGGRLGQGRRGKGGAGGDEGSGGGGGKRLAAEFAKKVGVGAGGGCAAPGSALAAGHLPRTQQPSARRAGGPAAQAPPLRGSPAARLPPPQVHVSIYADGPTRVLCFSDERRVAAAEEDESSALHLGYRLSQVGAGGWRLGAGGWGVVAGGWLGGGGWGVAGE
jgi:hypothetical protein